jgi:hypothetical protein
MHFYIKYSITCSVTKKTHKTDCVSDKHPFEWLKFFDSFSDKWKLIEWVEITKEEYEKGKLVVGVG